MFGANPEKRSKDHRLMGYWGREPVLFSVRPQGEARGRPKEQTLDRWRRIEWSCGPPAPRMLVGRRAALPALGCGGANSPDAYRGSLVPHSSYARDRRSSGSLGSLRPVRCGRASQASAAPDGSLCRYGHLHRARCGVRSSHGVLSRQQRHVLGRELLDLSRYWSCAPCWASPVLGQVVRVCGLTMRVWTPSSTPDGRVS